MASETDYASYGQFAWMYNADPEVHGIIDQATREQWTPDKLAATIQGTAWWRTMVDSDRNWQAEIARDPRTAQNKVQAKAEEITKQAQQMGVTLKPGVAESFADSFYRYGWGEIPLENSILSQFTYEKGKTQGAAGVIETQLRAAAGDYMVPLADPTIQSWIVSIEQGRNSVDTFKTYLAHQAASRFPTLVSGLDRGFTVRELVDPFVQDAAKELEIAPESIDLADAKWQKFLDFRDDKGQPAQMTRQQWIHTLRTDPTYGWDKTQGARTTAAQLSTQLLQQFGAVA